MSYDIFQKLVYNPMTHSEALEWIAALRSGKYEQGGGALKKPDGTFCCLGVEREIHPQQCAVVDNNYMLEFAATVPVGDYGEQDIQSFTVRLPRSWQSKLAEMNDNRVRGWDFDSIADHVQEFYLNGIILSEAIINYCSGAPK